VKQGLRKRGLWRADWPDTDRQASSSRKRDIGNKKSLPGKTPLSRADMIAFGSVPPLDNRAPGAKR
jgi:hypothetical protein